MLMDKIKENFVSFSIKKFSSNVVEKCVERADYVISLLCLLIVYVENYLRILRSFTEGHCHEDYDQVLAEFFRCLKIIPQT